MKTITSDVRTDNQFAILHLFTFDMHDLDGVFVETLRFTDFDIYVTYDSNEYIPLAITFDALNEDLSMQTNSINISIDNVSGDLSAEALASEWRNNPASITRVIFTPPSETPVDGITYPYGYGDNLDVYPQIDLTLITKDVYTLFSGYIDNFSATEQSLTGTISTQLVHWQKPFPRRTYNQNEYNSIINAMVETIYWGRIK